MGYHGHHQASLQPWQKGLDEDHPTVSGQGKHSPYSPDLRLPWSSEGQWAPGSTRKGDSDRKKPHPGSALLPCNMGGGERKGGSSWSSKSQEVVCSHAKEFSPSQAETLGGHTQGKLLHPSGATIRDSGNLSRPKQPKSTKTAPQSL